MIPHDKQLHILTSAFLVILISWLTDSVPTGILTALILGMGKEVYDLTGHGTSELGDVVANVVGIVLGWVVVYFFRLVS